MDPGLWPVLMEEICAAANTTGAVLLRSDMRTPEVPITPSITEFIASYFSHDLHIADVRAQRGVPLLLTNRSVIRDQDLFRNEGEMRRDPLYAHAEKFGLSWWAGVGFRAGSALWALALQRSAQDGPFEASDVQALETLPARLTETATLSKAVGRQALTGATNALHLVHQPAVAMDQLGYIIDINASAELLLGGDLQIRNRRLTVCDGRAAGQLESLVSQLRTTSDTAPLSTTPIVIQRQDKRPILINVLPVDGAARTPFLGARAMLVFTDLEHVRVPEQETLRCVFGLSPAEARVAGMIATGLSTNEAADELAIGVETVRKQLKSIFAKVGVHRQGELVALLSRL